MRITIRDVARRLNLSITTVSRALDGYSDVAKSTREEVQRVANEMGYMPNRAARQLRRRQTDTLGYVLPASLPRFNEPFYSELVAGLGNRSAQRGYDLLISSVPPDTETERQLYRYWVQSRRVDGMVINRMRLDDWRVNYMAEMDFPFVALETPLRIPSGAHCGFIEVDSQAAFAQLVGLLVGRGHHRIAYIGGPADFKIHRQRLEGYQQGLAQAGIDFDQALLGSANLDRTGGYEQARRLLALPQPPTALMCVNDMTALGALHAAQDLGRLVGRDLAISGFDGADDMQHSLPPLTTFRQPLYDIACRMADMLVDLVTGSGVGEQIIHVAPELIERQSTLFTVSGAIP